MYLKVTGFQSEMCGRNNSGGEPHASETLLSGVTQKEPGLFAFYSMVGSVIGLYSPLAVAR